MNPYTYKSRKKSAAQSDSHAGILSALETSVQSCARFAKTNIGATLGIAMVLFASGAVFGLVLNAHVEMVSSQYDPVGTQSALAGSRQEVLGASTTKKNQMQPLSVSFSRPAPGAVVKGSINVSAIVSRIPDVQVQFQVDGQNVGSVLSKAPFTAKFDTTTLSEGKHQMQVNVSDKNGTVSALLSESVTVQNNGTSTTATDLGGSVNSGQQRGKPQNSMLPPQKNGSTPPVGPRGQDGARPPQDSSSAPEQQQDIDQ